LTQSIDYQFRISGKRNFQKHEIIIPLIQFYTFRCLSANDFILTSHFSKLAKRIFKNAKSIILVETLEDGFLPVLEKSGIDRIFVMLKFDENQNNHFIPLELINTLNETLNTMIIQENDVDDNQIIFAGLE
ncbi:MAG: hypothetical protein H8E57_06895, partial [Candidatus Cloacimonetes bacterium]|nr:hypothetical protein [Candidatus Cloacimonadota bacterium]